MDLEGLQEIQYIEKKQNSQIVEMFWNFFGKETYL